MAWTIPKTYWKISDRFNIADYNRIKNNLAYLHEKAVELYTSFEVQDMGSDKTSYADFFYADEINTMENNLDTIASNTFGKDYGTKKTFADNGAFIDYNELNRIESASLDLYNQLSGQYEGRRMLTFMLGGKEDF